MQRKTRRRLSRLECTCFYRDISARCIHATPVQLAYTLWHSPSNLKGYLTPISGPRNRLRGPLHRGISGALAATKVRTEPMVPYLSCTPRGSRQSAQPQRTTGALSTPTAGGPHCFALGLRAAKNLQFRTLPQAGNSTGAAVPAASLARADCVLDVTVFLISAQARNLDGAL